MRLTHLWRDHVAAGYSSKLAGVEIAGSDAGALDAEITACVSAYLYRGMAVDERIERRLIEVSRALTDKQAHSEEPIAAYCACLNELVIAVLEESRSTRGRREASSTWSSGAVVTSAGRVSPPPRD